MTHIYDDPARFADDALEGFCDAHSDLVRRVEGGAVRRRRPAEPKVAVIFGGGSGHYPAFAGIVGPGFGDGAVVGNIFTSPSAQRAVSVARAAHSGRGVVFSYGNYAGDVMNFAMASERLSGEGVDVENVLVTDDIASAPASEIDKRRGIAGDFTVFKVLGAAAERGDDLAEVVRLGRRANDLTRTIGTAFAGCTFPGADAPLFTLEPGAMGLGLGIHGEPGLADVPLPRATDLGRELVERVLAERPDGAGDRVAVILNGLGATKLEELFVLWRTVAPALRAAGLTLVAPEVGELVTSLDMAGVSLTVMYLDDELEPLWLAPALTPAFRRGDASATGTLDDEPEAVTESHTRGPAAGEASRAAGQRALEALEVAARAVVEAEAELGRIDAVAGDGDHGRGMVKGLTAATAAARRAVAAAGGVDEVLTSAGDAWADEAGGTSGVLWGAGLRALGERLRTADAPSAPDVVAAVGAFEARVRELGGAQVGDKTMVDALVPFSSALVEESTDGGTLPDAWAAAARQASAAAAATSELLPRKGRARPLGEKSLGTPDPGATSFALIVTELARHLGRSGSGEETNA